MPSKGEEISASVDETNKLRKELGLKPLKADKDKKDEEEIKKGSSKAPVDYWEEKKEEDQRKTREKDDKKKRLREESNLEKGSAKDIYKAGPRIQDAVQEEPGDAADWVAKHRSKKAEKPARIDKDRERDRRRKESNDIEDELMGMHIAHNMDKFEEGMDATFVLADTPLLDDKGELRVDRGELENIEWKDKSRLDRNKELKNKKAGYDAYAGPEDEVAFGPGGMPRSSLLSKYDELPQGDKGFTLGASEHVIDEEAERRVAQMTNQAHKQTLQGGPLRVQRDFMTTAEAGKTFQSRFKSNKRPKKRKQVKDDDEEPVPEFKMLERPEGCDSDEEDPELYESLRKQRRCVNQRPQMSVEESTKEIVKTVKEENGFSGGLTMTGTTQFCKSVETAVEKVESFKSETFQGATMYKKQQQAKRKQMRGVKVAKAEKEKNDVAPDTDAVRDAMDRDSDEEDAGMAEPPLDMSVASALEYLRSRDHIGNDQDTCRKRNKEHRPLETSTEEGEIKLEYRDKFGRVQNPKEAFRTISWKFHGKMPGHKNYERRLQRYEREMTLRKKANKELPTERALKAVQKHENKPHMILGAEK